MSASVAILPLLKLLFREGLSAIDAEVIIWRIIGVIAVLQSGQMKQGLIQRLMGKGERVGCV